MLDAAGNAIRLHTKHVFKCCHCCEVRVFTHALEVATTHRRAMQVHRGGQMHSRTLCHQLAPEQFANLAHQTRIPRCSNRCTARNIHGSRPIELAATNTGRAIAHAHTLKLHPIIRHRVPHIATSEQGNLLSQRHLIENLFDVLAHLIPPVVRRHPDIHD